MGETRVQLDLPWDLLFVVRLRNARLVDYFAWEMKKRSEYANCVCACLLYLHIFRLCWDLSVHGRERTLPENRHRISFMDKFHQVQWLNKTEFNSSFSKRNPQHHHQKQNRLPTKLGGGAFARRIPDALTSLKLFGSQCCIHLSLDCWNKLSSNSSCANRASNVTFARPRIAPHTSACCPVLANFCPFQRLFSPLAKFPSNFARIRSLANLRWLTVPRCKMHLSFVTLQLLSCDATTLATVTFQQLLLF